jgi:hypothetical protein
VWLSTAESLIAIHTVDSDRFVLQLLPCTRRAKRSRGHDGQEFTLPVNLMLMQAFPTRLATVFLFFFAARGCSGDRADTGSIEPTDPSHRAGSESASLDPAPTVASDAGSSVSPEDAAVASIASAPADDDEANPDADPDADQDPDVAQEPSVATVPAAPEVSSEEVIRRARVVVPTIPSQTGTTAADWRRFERMRRRTGYSGPPPPPIPSFDARPLNREIRRIQPDLLACYRDALQHNPPSEGHVFVRVVFDSQGVVRGASVSRTDIERLGPCFRTAVREIHIPPQERLLLFTFHFRLEIAPDRPTRTRTNR